MAYRHSRKSIRETYEEHFAPMDTREVTVHRVVNIVDRRSPMHRHSDYDRGFQEDMYYGGLRHYQDIGDCHGDSSYPLNDRRYFDEHPNFAFRRNSPPPRNDSSYSQSYGRDDLRHHIGSRSNNRPGPYFRSRGRGSGPPRRPASDRKAKEDHDDYRKSPPIVITRDCSPARREAPPPAHGRLGPNTNNRSSSPDRDKGHAHQQPQHKSSAATCNTPSSSVETSPHSSASSKEKAPASVAESEEVATASMEPKPAPVEDVKTRRLEAIKAKAQEIEKDYRQDCETFRTVVKMLVAKEPSLENLLQAPLDENLSEIKQRCLDSLRHFVKELDEILEQPSSSEKATSQKTLN